MTNIPQDLIDFPIDEVNAKLDAIPLDQKHLLKAWSYTALIDSRIANLTGEIMKSDSLLASGKNAYEKAKMLAIDSLLKDRGVKDHFLYTSIKSNMEYRGPVYVKDGKSQKYGRTSEVCGKCLEVRPYSTFYGKCHPKISTDRRGGKNHRSIRRQAARQYP